jgi:hypothetical protein
MAPPRKGVVTPLRTCGPLAPREHGESWRRRRVTECGARFSFRSPKELQRSSRDEFRLVFRNEMATIWHKLNF